MDTPTGKNKKIVNVPAHEAPPAQGSTPSDATEGPAWTPTPEAKKKATARRLVAGGLWALAIAGEVAAIFWLLKQNPVNMIALICLLVGIGAFAIAGSLLWKQANRLDPASKQETTRFFIQNQLGAIITVIAFLPLIIMIFLNKDMTAKQKGLAGTIGILICGVAVALGVSVDSPSVEQYAEESNVIVQLTGENTVFWTKSGQVFHVCSSVPEVNKESADGQIFQGTVAQAHEAGKTRLTLKWESEAVKSCGYTQAQVDAVNAGSSSPDPTTLVPSPSMSPAPDAP
ncbi:hypothetical protein [Plantibacter sp. RU18]|uniref:hypothetical protein n=1 Tax=Plantibacter sp. RU18 TaxID=3158143 RepID=UPI003D36F6EC